MQSLGQKIKLKAIQIISKAIKIKYLGIRIRFEEKEIM